MLDITVFKVPDLSKIVQVSEVGTISYPLAGRFKLAEGAPARPLEQELTRLLGAKYLKNPQITSCLLRNIIASALRWRARSRSLASTR